VATVTFSVTDDVAHQLAQFCKRSTFNDFLDHTEAHLPYDERQRLAYKMIAGIEAVQAGLRAAGFAPR
jgi:hypothetical protein